MYTSSSKSLEWGSEKGKGYTDLKINSKSLREKLVKKITSLRDEI